MNNKYPIGTRLMAKEGPDTGVVISAEELLEFNPKLILPADICVKWFDERGFYAFATTFDEWWLDDNCTILSGVI